MSLRRFHLAILLMACGCWLGGGGSTIANHAFQNDSESQERDEHHVDSAREILGRGLFEQDREWYDNAADDAKLIPIQPPKQTKNSGSSWLSELFSWLGEEVFTFSFFGTQISISLLIIIIALIILFPIILLLWMVYRKRTREARKPKEVARTDADRIESLPFDITPTDNLLDIARKCAENGKYADAIIYVFSYQLVELDKAHMIRLTKGKTNRQYLRELGRGNIRSLLEHTTEAFEDAFFGHYEINKDRFETCWSRMSEFHQLTEQGARSG